MEEELFYRTDISYTGILTNKILSNGYMIERVHDHTLHHLRVHGRTGTRANKYSNESYISERVHDHTVT